MNRQQLLGRLDGTWSDLHDSYAGLPDERLLEVGVTSLWSVRDVLAHVTWWDAEAIAHLPEIARSIRPVRYSVKYGGIDAFNALMTEQKRGLTLDEIRSEMAETHERLRAYVGQAPEDLFVTDTRWRRRLRLDTFGHYPLHAKAIRAWRERTDGRLGVLFD